VRAAPHISVTVPRISPIAWLWSEPLRWFAAVYLAIPLACAIDAELSLTAGQQWLLAAPAWLIVAAGLRELPARRRLALVCFLPLITLAELGLTHGLGWYAYRLDNLPAWIPPAHGVVFLTALRAIDMHAVPTRVLAFSAALMQLAYSALALVLFGDALGAVLALVFLTGMALLPPDGKRFYASLGLVVAYLELVGTALGTWSWAPVSLGLTAANPPSGAVGGYSLVDGGAFLLAAALAWLATQAVRARRARAVAADGACA
jgi:hypothetical protein